MLVLAVPPLLLPAVPPLLLPAVPPLLVLAVHPPPRPTTTHSKTRRGKSAKERTRYGTVPGSVPDPKFFFFFMDQDS